MYPTSGNIGLAAGSTLGAGQRAYPVEVNMPLEQRMDRLYQAVERAQKLRAHLSIIADRIQLGPETGKQGTESPPAADLSGRFAQSLNYLHANLDEIEVLAARISDSLFDNSNKAQPIRG